MQPNDSAPAAMKRNGEQRPDGMDEKTFLEKWKYELFGRVINAIACNDTNMRARIICNLPAVLERMLKDMHRDVRGEATDLLNGNRGRPC